MYEHRKAMETQGETLRMDGQRWSEYIVEGRGTNTHVRSGRTDAEERPNNFQLRGREKGQEDSMGMNVEGWWDYMNECTGTEGQL